MSWDAYARSQRHNAEFYAANPVQERRARRMVERCVGTVLDVGGSDGYIANLIAEAGHPVTVFDISQVRLDRVQETYGLPVEHGDARHLPYEDQEWDTVVLGELLEHLDNPGAALAEAFRVAKERVVFSVPLNGWEDPTHQWRISLDVCLDPMEHRQNRTKGQEMIVTFQQGACWPEGYRDDDPSWARQFEERR